MMHRIFHSFIDSLSSESISDSLRDAMSQAADGLDLSCFAYLSMPDRVGARSRIIGTFQIARVVRGSRDVRHSLRIPIPIHNNGVPVSAVSFASDERRPQFERTI